MTDVARLAALDEPTPEQVIERCARHFGISPEELTNRSQARPIVGQRMIAMAVCRWSTTASYPMIGDAFGRDHTTVHSACKRVESDPRALRLARLLVDEVEGRAIPGQLAMRV